MGIDKIKKRIEGLKKSLDDMSYVSFISLHYGLVECDGVII